MRLRRADSQPAAAWRENDPTRAEANLELTAKDLHPLVVIVRVLDLKVAARLEDEKEIRSELVDRVRKRGQIYFTLQTRSFPASRET